MPPVNAAEFKAAAAKRRKTTDIEVEGLGAVRLRALSAGDAQRFQAEIKKATASGGDAEAMAFTLIARSWINEEGGLLFEEDEGIEVAKSLDPEAYNTLATAVLTLNGLNKSAVDDALKNSGSTPGEPSPTASPESTTGSMST